MRGQLADADSVEPPQPSSASSEIEQRSRPAPQSAPILTSERYSSMSTDRAGLLNLCHLQRTGWIALDDATEPTPTQTARPAILPEECFGVMTLPRRTVLIQARPKRQRPSGDTT